MQRNAGLGVRTRAVGGGLDPSPSAISRQLVPLEKAAQIDARRRQTHAAAGDFFEG